MILQIEKIKTELSFSIEKYRQKLNNQIKNEDAYIEILETSQELDKLINQYIRFTT